MIKDWVVAELKIQNSLNELKRIRTFWKELNELFKKHNLYIRGVGYEVESETIMPLDEYYDKFFSDTVESDIKLPKPKNTYLNIDINDIDGYIKALEQ